MPTRINPAVGIDPAHRVDVEVGETLSAYVRRARAQRHVTLDDLVRATGLSLSTLRKIEEGRTPNPGLFTLRAIWRALDLPDDAFAKVERPS